MPAFRSFGAARDAVEKFTMGRRQPWREGTELEELLLQVDRDESHGGVGSACKFTANHSVPMAPVAYVAVAYCD